MTTTPKRSTMRSTVVYPFRAFSAGKTSELPAARAWRILARPAAEFVASSPAVALGTATVAPSGCRDGVYPVWVRLTGPEGARDAAGELLLVTDDSWQATPTGPEWRIEIVAAGAADMDRFAYVVQTVGSLSECGSLKASSSVRRGRVIYDSGSVLADAVITTPVLDLRDVQAIRLDLRNSNLTNTRSVSLAPYAEDLATEIGGAFTVLALAANTRAWLGWSDLSAATSSFVSGCVPPGLVVSMAAAGAGTPATARIIVTGR